MKKSNSRKDERKHNVTAATYIWPPGGYKCKTNISAKTLSEEINSGPNKIFLPMISESTPKPIQLREGSAYNDELNQLRAVLYHSKGNTRQLMDTVENLMEQTNILKGRFLESIAGFQAELCEYSNNLVLKSQMENITDSDKEPDETNGAAKRSENSKEGKSPFYVAISAKSAFKKIPTMLNYINMAREIHKIQTDLEELISEVIPQFQSKKKPKNESFHQKGSDEISFTKVQNTSSKYRRATTQTEECLPRKGIEVSTETDHLVSEKISNKVLKPILVQNPVCYVNYVPSVELTNADKTYKKEDDLVSKNMSNKILKLTLVKSLVSYVNYVPQVELTSPVKKNKAEEESTDYPASEESVTKQESSLKSIEKCDLMKKDLPSVDLVPGTFSKPQELISSGTEQKEKTSKDIKSKIHNDAVRLINECLRAKTEESVRTQNKEQSNSMLSAACKPGKCNCLHAVYKVLKECQSRKVLTLSNHHEKVTISPTTSEVVHYVNDSHIVICNFPKEAKAQWIAPKGDVVTERKGRVHVEEKQSGQLALVFEQIALPDKGDWTCMIEDGAKKSFRMVINRPISFMDTAILQTAKEGKDANIRCEVRGDPEPTVSWSFNGKSIILPHAKFTKLADGLLVKKVSKNDSGEYTCRAFQISETINEVDERVILLKIEHKPLPVEKSADVQYGYINGVVNLTCEALAEPQANFSWYRHGKKISPKVHQIFVGNHSSMLQIPIKEATAFGDYKCKATNPLGSLEKTIKLQEGTKPEPPTQFTLRGVNSDTFDIDVGAVRTSNIRDEMDINGYTFQVIPEHEWRASGGNWEKAREYKFGFEDGVTFLINNLAPNTTFLVRVASKNLAGLSDWTETKKFTTYPKEPMMNGGFNRICPLSGWDTLAIATVTTFVSRYATSDSFNILRIFHVIL